MSTPTRLNETVRDVHSSNTQACGAEQNLQNLAEFSEWMLVKSGVEGNGFVRGILARTADGTDGLTISNC